MKVMQYHIITYGCQLNKSDSDRIAAVLDSAGYKPASKIEETDLIVINMCSVRQSAVDRVYGLAIKLKTMKIANRKLKIILTGCFLKKDGKKFEEIFDYVLDKKDLPKWPKVLKANPSGNSYDRRNFRTGQNGENFLKIAPKYLNGISAGIPIMIGCNNFCSYCVVPYVRGREISRPAEEIICEIKNLIKNGYKEIWLLGQNVNSYKDKKISFPKLLKKADDIPGNFWIRFTSSHPKDFSDDLIKVMATCKKVTPYLNLPVQAGDDKVLRKMNRPYTIAQYKKLIKKVRIKIPNITISTDIIVGFPGETKRQFLNSVKLFKEIKYDMAYISEYSPRPGTAAYKMKDDLPKREKAARKTALNEVLKKTALEKNQRYVGKIVDVLITGKKQASTSERSPVVNRAKRGSTTGAKNIWFGKTREYKTIQIKSNRNLIGEFVKVKVISATPWQLKAEIKN